MPCCACEFCTSKENYLIDVSFSSQLVVLLLSAILACLCHQLLKMPKGNIFPFPLLSQGILTQFSSPKNVNQALLGPLLRGCLLLGLVLFINLFIFWVWHYCSTIEVEAADGRCIHPWLPVGLLLEVGPDCCSVSPRAVCSERSLCCPG